MPIPSVPSYVQTPNNFSELLNIQRNYFKKFSDGLTNITKVTNLTKSRVGQVTKAAKEASGFAKEAKKITDFLKKGQFKNVNPKLGNAIGFALNLASIGLSLLTINQIGKLQTTQIKIDGIQSKDLSTAFQQSINNALRLNTLREQLSKFIAQYKDDKDKLFAEAGISQASATEARELSEKAKKQANDALYETREGRAKFELKLSDFTGKFNQLTRDITNQNAELANRINDNFSISESARKIGNDALYEVRQGRNILENKISNLQNKINLIDPRNNLAQISSELSRLRSTATNALNTANKALQFKAQPGPQGRTGATGPQGRTGATGPQGRTGATGPQGRTGATGPQGRTGIAGPQGKPGLIGPQGKPGIAGPQGKPGIAGPQGKTGLIGPQGKTGLIGPQGRNGLDGKNGKDGKDGKDVDEQQYNTLLQKIALIPPLIARVPNTTINGMPKPLTAPQVEAAASAGVCRSTQSGGCMSNALNNNADKINQNTNNWGKNLLNKFNAAANATQLALLKKVDAKLGAQIVGGISGQVTKNLERLNAFSKWAQLDRILNIMIWVNTTHNAMMLSSNLTNTLFSTIDNIAGLFFKDIDGVDIDSKKAVGGFFENMAKSIFGVKAWEETKVKFNLYNRIYQSAQNVLNSVTSMFNSVYGALDVIGDRVSKIGNALRWFGVVAENAFSWMNPVNQFSNPIITRLTKISESADAVEQVSAEVLSISDNGKELIKNTQEIKKGLDDLSKLETEKEEKERSTLVIPEVKDTDVA